MAALLLNSCGNLPTASSEQGSLSLRIWVENQLSKQQKTTETTWDSLIIQISAPDMETMRYSQKVDRNRPAVLDTVEGVPEGKKRLVEAWTCTKAGLMVNYGSYIVPEMSAGEIVPVALELIPVRGSIYINLAGVPIGVDSIFAAFYYGTDSVVAKDKRAAIMYLSLDNVPDSTYGTLVIKGTDAKGVTIYSDSLSFIFYTMQNVTMQAQFMSKPGGISLDIGVIVPGATVVSGRMGQQGADSQETGPLVISEIMYYSEGDSDYIEIHNPSAEPFSADSVVLEIVNTSNISRCVIRNIRIAANGFFVIGDVDAPSSWADTVFQMDLTTTGRWVYLKAKDGSIMDWVSYTSDDQDWPDGLRLHSIVTDTLYSDAEANNYGSNWKISQTLADSSDCFGSPGK
jgi:hypothetical protein